MHAVALGVAAVCVLVAATVAGANAQPAELSPSPAPTTRPCAKTMIAAATSSFTRPIVFVASVTANTAKYGVALGGPDPDPNPGLASTAYFQRVRDTWCLLGYGGDLVAPEVAESLGVPRAEAVKLMSAFDTAATKAFRRK